MKCPSCGNWTLRLSPKCMFHKCDCGYCVTAPGVAERAPVEPTERRPDYSLIRLLAETMRRKVSR